MLALLIAPNVMTFNCHADANRSVPKSFRSQSKQLAVLATTDSKYEKVCTSFRSFAVDLALLLSNHRNEERRAKPSNLA